MLANQGGVQPNLPGVQILWLNFFDKHFRRKRIVGISIVAQGEIAKIHINLSRLLLVVARFAFSLAWPIIIIQND